MTPEKIKQLTKHAFGSGEPKERAQQLRVRYVQCAERFGQIVACAPGHSQAGRVLSANINLGEQDTDAGTVFNVARVAMTTYDHANHRSGFSAVTTFEAILKATKKSVQVEQETFGTLGVGFGSGIATPAFVRNPHTTCEGPWDHAVPGYRYPLETEWDAHNYSQVSRTLNEMISQAEETQNMLITAMQDETLNGRELATRAAGLMLPSAVTA